MVKINENFLNIKKQYLFSEISQEVNNIINKDNNIKLIDMSIGDISLPIDKEIIDELYKAVTDMGDDKNFKGYSPEQGYLFLRKTISDLYHRFDVNIDVDDIFINDGSKSDLGNILDIFSKNNVIGLQSVCYPVYLDVCKMGGFNITYFKSCEDNDFLPMPCDIIGDNPDLIYLCSPNNPTGMAYNLNQLQKWIDYALDNQIIIFYDAAYQAFIKDEMIPKTIYEIDGSKQCVIEICSLSKSAGFTGLRLGYTIVPKDINIKMFKENVIVNKLWKRRQATKFNGASYLAQRAADKFLKSEKKIKNVEHCLNNARKLIDYLNESRYKYWGGINSPYIWIKCPKQYSSKDYFKYLIYKFGIVTTPGIGFGEDGEGYVRVSTFFKDDLNKIDFGY